MKLFKTINKIHRYFSEYGKNPIEIEIMRTRKALSQYKNKMDIMNEDFTYSRGVCCTGCAFGPYYTELEEKIKRVEARLSQLIEKQNKLNRW